MSWMAILTLHGYWVVPSVVVWGLYLLARRVDGRWVRWLVYAVDALLVAAVVAVVAVWVAASQAGSPAGGADDHVAGLGDMGVGALVAMMSALVLASAVWSAWATWHLGTGGEPRWLRSFDGESPDGE